MYALSADTLRLARVTIHDEVDGLELGDALDGVATIDARPLAALVEEHALGPTIRVDGGHRPSIGELRDSSAASSRLRAGR